MNYELEFEAEPFAGETSRSAASPCGCGRRSDAQREQTEEEFGFSDIANAIGSVAGAVGKAAAGLFGGPSRIIDLTAKADKTLRKATRDPRTVTALVLHQMACCANRKDPLNSYLKIKSHYSILRDGRILQMHPVSSLLWASHGFNSKSVAVEFAGNFPNTKGKWWKGEKYGKNRPTQAQIEAGRYLIQHLVKTIGLKHVLAHRQSSNTRTNDPGPEIWFHVGQWAVDTLKLSDGGPGFKIGTGAAIPSEWRAWNKPVTGEIGVEGETPDTELAHDHWHELADESELEEEQEEEAEEDEFRRGRAFARSARMGRSPTAARRGNAPRPQRPPRANLRKRPSRPMSPRPPRRAIGRFATFGPLVARGSEPCVCPQHGSESIRWLQSSLNQVLGLRLPVTGWMDAATRSAVRSFQQRHSLPSDGIAGPEVRRALIEAKSGAAEPSATEPADSEMFEFEH